MHRRTVLCVCLTMSSVTLFVVQQLLHPLESNSFQQHAVVAQSKYELLINTSTCVIPMMHLFPLSLKNIIQVRKSLKCQYKAYITYQANYTIHVNNTAVKTVFKNVKTCQYVPFVKKKNNNFQVEHLRNKSKNFTDFVAVQDDFVTIKCYNDKDELVGLQKYAFIFRNGTRDKILNAKYNKSANRQPMNVLVMAFESTSRLNFVRHMNLTYQYLMKEMKAVEMLGFNKRGRNTFPNIATIFLGRDADKLNEERGFLDKYPFVWKNFSQSGYRTFTIEDSIYIAAFLFQRKGFKEKHMDHDLLPYMLELEKTGQIQGCYENKVLPQIMLEKVAEFVEVYCDDPHFAFSMITGPTHDDVNGLGIEDQPYFNMLKTLNNKNRFNNTVLILVGDHGYRYGKMRRTFQGEFEVNLPALFIVLPEWFQKDHVGLYKNLISNSKKLTSNIDLYATLLDIIGIGKGQSYIRHDGKDGMSLLRNIPDNRTCKDLLIPQRYCTCDMLSEIDHNDSFVQKIAYWIVNEMNTILKHQLALCSKLNLYKVISAKRRKASGKDKISNNDHVYFYKIKLTSVPGNGLFEAGVLFNFNNNSTRLSGEIDRMNRYAGQTRCIKNISDRSHVERFCVCRKLKSFVTV